MNGLNLLLLGHVANEYGRWVKDVKWFGLSHRPWGLASTEATV